MRVLKYLNYRKNIMLTFLVMIGLTGLVIYLDPNFMTEWHNILYLCGLQGLFCCAYVLIDYIRYSREMKVIEAIAEHSNYYEIKSIRSNDPRIEGLKSLTDEINRDHENYMNDASSETKAFEDFITSWVHSIKIPISAQKLVIENDRYVPSKETLSKLEDELMKIDGLVEQALYYARLDSFDQDYLIGEVELKPIVHETVKGFAKIFIGKRITIDIQVDEIRVLTDGKWLKFIIEQIISNALKYSSENGRIQIRIIEEAHTLALVIEDNGIGIKPEDLPRVFNRGFTGETGREVSLSTGMGLFIANQLAEKLGHKMTIESKENEFTRVSIHFKKADEFYRTGSLEA